MEDIDDLKARAEQGDSDAHLNLGFNFYFEALRKTIENSEKTTLWSEENGWISEEATPEDLYMAEHWWTKAAEQGNAVAQRTLGALYHIAEYGLRDFGKAAYWYTNAANQGDSDAQLMLGYCYFKGEGVPEDKDKAVHWWSMASMQGNDEAKFRLAEVKHGKGRKEMYAYSPFCNNKKIFP
jgi:TPR repeat protein